MRVRHPYRLWITACTLLLLVLSLYAQDGQESQSAAGLAVLSRLKAGAVEGTWRIRPNAKTGLPRLLTGARSRPYEGKPAEAAAAFVTEYRALFLRSEKKADTPVMTLVHARTSKRSREHATEASS